MAGYMIDTNLNFKQLDGTIATLCNTSL